MKILAIIQARMGSSRLPGKTLMQIGDKTAIDHVMSRVQQSKLITDTFLATSIDPNNLPLIQHLAQQGHRIFAGSENDVLDRYYQVAKLIQPNIVVRLTGDCPLIDPQIIDLTIQKYIDSNAQYTYNCMEGGNMYPDGMDVEVFAFKALEQAALEASKPSEREHVTPYIRESGKFIVTSLQAPHDYKDVRITLDEENDLQVIKQIYDKLEDKLNYTLNDIIKVLVQNPEITEINQHITRNIGYLKSLQND